MSDNVTLPCSFAVMGPTLKAALAFICVGETLSIFSQPGMHALNISISFKAAQTSVREAIISRSPFMSMDFYRLIIFVVFNVLSRQFA